MILVVSPGGMGCSYILNRVALSQPTNSKNDLDRKKHAPCPFDSRFDGDDPKVVYVWNDPLKAILSMHRRGWLKVQCKKLEGWAYAARSLELLWGHTASCGMDIYGIQTQAENWLCHKRWPTYFHDTRRMQETQGELGDFVGEDLSDLRCKERSEYDLSVIPSKIRVIYDELDQMVRAWGMECNRNVSG